jgi:hypothetical protein
MSNPTISRTEVHRYSEACAEAGEGFTPIALRLMRGQRRLARFIEQNSAALGIQESQAAGHMTAVCLRVFDQVGGRMDRVAGSVVDEAADKVSALVAQVLPLDEKLPERVRQIPVRAQPNLLDEVLWALYEIRERNAEESMFTVDRSGLLFLTMWTVVEALDASWKASADYQPETDPEGGFVVPPHQDDAPSPAEETPAGA